MKTSAEAYCSVYMQSSTYARFNPISNYLWKILIVVLTGILFLYFPRLKTLSHTRE